VTETEAAKDRQKPYFDFLTVKNARQSFLPNALQQYSTVAKNKWLQNHTEVCCN